MAGFELPSSAAIAEMVEDFIQNDGADELLRQGVYGEGFMLEKLTQIGEDFAAEFNKAYGAAVIFGHKEMMPSSITPSYSPSTKKYTVNIRYSEDSLQRESLNVTHMEMGVYDIVGLLTKGYDIPDDKPTPRGYWNSGGYVESQEREGNNLFLRSGFTFAKRHREGTPILQAAIDAFRIKYPDVEIRNIPRNWK